MTASKRWRCYDAGRTSQFPLCSLASTPQLPLLNRADHASTKSIPRLPTSVMRSEERTPSIRPSRDAYGPARGHRFETAEEIYALAERLFEGATALRAAKVRLPRAIHEALRR